MNRAFRRCIGPNIAVWSIAVLCWGASLAASASPSVLVSIPLDSTNVADKESNMGDLLADAVRSEAQADAAFVPADEMIATVIPAGNIAVSHIVQTLRYAQDPTDTIVVLELTGEQLRQVAERSVSRLPQPFDGFLQVSGMAITYDVSRPLGHRVTSVTVGGASVADKQTFRVATVHAIADGSFGYFAIWTPSAVISSSKTTVAGAFSRYLIAQRTINLDTQGRIAP